MSTIFARRTQGSFTFRNAAIMHSYMHGATYAEIARKFNLSPYRIQQIVHRKMSEHRSWHQRKQYELYLDYIREWKSMDRGE